MSKVDKDKRAMNPTEFWGVDDGEIEALRNEVAAALRAADDQLRAMTSTVGRIGTIMRKGAER